MELCSVLNDELYHGYPWLPMGTHGTSHGFPWIMCMIASLQQQGEMGVGKAGTDVKSPKIKASVACTTAGYDAVCGGGG